MSTLPSNPGVAETYLPLLQGAQSYLKALLDEIAPDSLVSAAWVEFYRLYDDLIRRFVIAQGISGPEVDDCVQEVWTEVATRLMQFHRPAGRPGLRAWLYALVRSKATNVYRKRIRRPLANLDEAVSAGNEPGDATADPATLYQQQWEQAVLESIFSQLRHELSTTNIRIMEMRLISHRSVAEVAQELGLPPAQIHARQHRILTKIRDRAAIYFDGPDGK